MTLTTKVLDYKGEEKTLTIKRMVSKWYVIDERNHTRFWGTLNECVVWVETYEDENKKEYTNI